MIISPGLRLNTLPHSHHFLLNLFVCFCLSTYFTSMLMVYILWGPENHFAEVDLKCVHSHSRWQYSITTDASIYWLIPSWRGIKKWLHFLDPLELVYELQNYKVLMTILIERVKMTLIAHSCRLTLTRYSLYNFCRCGGFVSLTYILMEVSLPNIHAYLSAMHEPELMVLCLICFSGTNKHYVDCREIMKKYENNYFSVIHICSLCVRVCVRLCMTSFTVWLCFTSQFVIMVRRGLFLLRVSMTLNYLLKGRWMLRNVNEWAW